MHGWCSHSNLPNDYDLSRWDINTDDNFDVLSVYSKTFPAGTISISEEQDESKHKDWCVDELKAAALVQKILVSLPGFKAR